jgi:hypothetical protein
MGSYGSGRRRSRNLGDVECAARLDLRWLRRLERGNASAQWTKDLSWAVGRDARVLARCLVTQRRRPDGSGQLDIHGGASVDAQKIEIVALPMRFGGVRLYYICPKLGHRCEVLYLHEGAFASRQAHRLTYRSQSLDKLGRLRRRADTLRRRRLGGEGHRRPRSAIRLRLQDEYRSAEAGVWTEVARRLGL